ncbi:MAG: hypothetical protein ACJA2G_002690 [Cognaticolwellia sp.]|jgi:hypothetical protein
MPPMIILRNNNALKHGYSLNNYATHDNSEIKITMPPMIILKKNNYATHDNSAQ